MRKTYPPLALFFLIFLVLFSAACSPRITLFRAPSETPLKERIVSAETDAKTGKIKQKILLIPIRGFISDYPSQGLLGARPSMVQDVVAQLRMAQKDMSVRAVVLMVNSPGGTTTASDILYHEIMQYKKFSNATVVACFLDIATSGAYYASLAADRIFSHPTGITGSVGTILLKPELYGLLDSIGVGMKAYKSGRLKDMGSIFRKATPEEHKLFENIIQDLNKRFLVLTAMHRKLSEKKLSEVATGRLFTASQAKDIGLVDEIGYVDDVLASVRSLAKLPASSPVVAYRREQTANDNEYNITSAIGPGPIHLMDLGPLDMASKLKAGFYYIWEPALP